MTQNEHNMKRAEKSARLYYYITKIDEWCYDQLIDKFRTEYDAYVYLVSRFPYMKRITNEHVSYYSQYGSSRSVFVTEPGSTEYYCIWKGSS